MIPPKNPWVLQSFSRFLLWRKLWIMWISVEITLSVQFLCEYYVKQVFRSEELAVSSWGIHVIAKVTKGHLWQSVLSRHPPWVRPCLSLWERCPQGGEGTLSVTFGDSSPKGRAKADGRGFIPEKVLKRVIAKRGKV